MCVKQCHHVYQCVCFSEFGSTKDPGSGGALEQLGGVQRQFIFSNTVDLRGLEGVD